MTATTDRCPGCHGSGIEMSGVTYAGMSEYVGCHECSPECPDDCGCRVSDDLTLIANEPVESCERCGAVLPPPYDRPEWAKSVAARHPGATQSPDGSPRAAEGLRGAESAVSDAEAAEWAALADAATEGPWRVSGRRVLGEGYGAEFVGIPDTAADAAFVAKSRWIVSRLLDDRERLTGEASRVPVLLADKAALMGDVDRLTAERDGARGMRVIATRAFETARRVLQEASGLPDDIDDPDCRDEMVLALRPRAEKAEAENARLVEEATVSAALLEIEIAKRESAEMRANRATADLDALESEDRRQDVQAKHWREVLRIRRELDGIRREMNDATEIIAKALGYRPSGLPLDGWPHLSTTGDHTPTSLAAEAAGVLAKASRLREGIEALAAEMQSDTCPACHAFYADEGSTTWGCDHTEGMQHAGDMLRALLAEGGE